MHCLKGFNKEHSCCEQGEFLDCFVSAFGNIKQPFNHK